MGEFAIGTNIAVEDVRGNILQDEKIPGVHIAFGHPYAEHTGQDWVSTTHIDCVAPHDVNVCIDGEAGHARRPVPDLRPGAWMPSCGGPTTPPSPRSATAPCCGDLEGRLGFPIEFRICETPLFLSEALTRELERAAWEIARAATSAEYLARTDRAVPAELAVPGEDAHTDLPAGRFRPGPDGGGRSCSRGSSSSRASPRSTASSGCSTRASASHFDIPAGPGAYFSGLDADGYVDCLREVIVGDCDPETVVLLEIEPETQKTRADFAATERLLGIADRRPAARCGARREAVLPP